MKNKNNLGNLEFYYRSDFNDWKHLKRIKTLRGKKCRGYHRKLRMIYDLAYYLLVDIHEEWSYLTDEYTELGFNSKLEYEVDVLLNYCYDILEGTVDGYIHINKSRSKLIIKNSKINKYLKLNISNETIKLLEID